MMSEDITYITAKHPLVGVWQGTEDDARAQYTITATGGGFSVSAVDIYDGEKFEISNVKWDGKFLTFDSYMESTGRRGKNSFCITSNDQIEVTFTFTETYIWQRVTDKH